MEKFINLINQIEPLLYIVVGALIALETGFIHNRYQSKINQIKEDEALLFEAECLLLEYTSNSSKEEIDCIDKLSKIAIRIKSKEYREYAVLLTQFALDKPFRTKRQQSKLLEMMQKAINAPVIKEYEKKTKKIVKSIEKKLKNKQK